MVGAGEEEDWGSMLDRLSACVTPQESEEIRRLRSDNTIPAPLLEVRLHNLVAGLLVKHALTTWNHLHASFPGYGNEGVAGPEAQEGTAGQSKDASEERQAGDEYTPSGEDADDPRNPGDEREQTHSGRSQQEEAEEPAGSRKRWTEAPPQATGSPVKQARQAAGSKPRCVEDNWSTLADYPRIVSWWHPTKNGTKQPGDYTHGSTRRIWLQCPGCPDCGEVHEWDTTGNSLVSRGAKVVCPSCASKGGSFCSCRAVSAIQRLVAEWHEDNPPPATVAQMSRRICKWRCANAACGHVWEVRPAFRVRGSGSNCPKCNKGGRKKAKAPKSS